ncbi:MAG: transposase [Rhizobiales bacterium]|nr:transposase [Hyphomicrobiales bacterium]
MAVKKGQKKRVCSDDEKRSICEQTTTAGVSVAQVARRYSMNANLIFKWLKDPRFAPGSAYSAAQPEDGVVVFLPVEVLDPLPVERAQTGAQPLSGAAISAHRVDITLSDGRRILVEGPTALSSILGLVQGLMA